MSNTIDHWRAVPEFAGAIPDDITGTAHRCVLAKRALKGAYEDVDGPSPDPVGALQDLLTDLWHLAKHLNLEPEVFWQQAVQTGWAERHAVQTVNPNHEPSMPPLNICTECGGDAYVGFSNWYNRQRTLIRKNERLCRKCARRRGCAV